MHRSLPLLLVVLCAVGAALMLSFGDVSAPAETSPQTQLSSAAAPIASSTQSSAQTPATSSVATSSRTSNILHSSKIPLKKVLSQATTSADASSPNEAVRVQNPYSTAPESSDMVNAAARAALVNILCEPRAGGSMRPISASGVLIDPRGVILTNAHVAQYVLLSESPDVDLECFVRTGSPATAQFVPSVLYIPPVWVNAHASEILDPHPTGTGEHDYALLFVTNTVDDSPLPAAFPYLPLDTREAIAFPGDSVLVASYPAEFIGGIAAQYDLFPDSSVTTIKQLLTFSSGSADLLSLGGIIEAQSGSSGGAVVNAWGRLVGLVVTTSSGTTTADRDLRALSLSYINTDIAAQTGTSLTTILAGDPAQETASFTQNTASNLLQQYIAPLSQ